MSKMTYKQVDHARDRLKTITRQLLGPAPDAVEKHDFDDLVEELIEGTIVIDLPKFDRALDKFLKARRNQRGYYDKPNFQGFLVTEMYGAETAKAQAVFDREDKVYQARKATVKVRAVEVEDQIVLGDQQAALLALQAFAQLVV